MRGKLINLPREVSRGIEMINLYDDMQLNLEKSADTIVGVIIDNTERLKQNNVLRPIIARFVIIEEKKLNLKGYSWKLESIRKLIANQLK